MWALILHGGAKQINPEEEQSHREGCVDALRAGQIVLERSGTAADAVEAAIRVLEDDPTFNAGFGSALNEDGEIEMCASMMEGRDFNVGAVTVVKGVRHPISVARALLYETPILLAAKGARRFAQKMKLELCAPKELMATEHGETPAKKGTHDTVGCIALDQHGNLAVGTSTGGLNGSPAGRVGDSPQPGCGYYADNTKGAVAFSGNGEQIARKILAARVMSSLDAGPNNALRTALEELEIIGGEAGGIVLTPQGAFGWDHTSREFAVAFISSEENVPRFFFRKEDEK